MKSQQRIFDKVFTISYNLVPGQTVNPSTRYYFTGYPNLKEIRVKAISVFLYDNREWYISLADRNKNIVLTNYPMRDLDLDLNAPAIQSRLRLFDISGVDLTASYFVLPGSGFSPIVPIKIFDVSFYY